MTIRNSTAFRNKILAGASVKDILEIGAVARPWTANTTWSLGDIIVPKLVPDLVNYFRCTVAGAGTVLAASEPTWVTTTDGVSTTTDNAATWTVFRRGCTVKIYSGTRPASPDDAIPVGSTLLATFNDVTFATSASSGSLAIAAGPFTATAAATGTAGFFRIAEGNDPDPSLASASTYARRDGTIAVSGGDMSMPNTAITSGAPQTLNSLSMTLALE